MEYYFYFFWLIKDSLKIDFKNFELKYFIFKIKNFNY